MAETQGMYDASQIFTNTDVDAKYSISSLVESSDTTDGFKAAYGNYKLLNTGAVETATDVKLPTITNAKWYIDVNSGLVYLVYFDSSKVPSWMATSDGMDQTLNEFVRVPKSDDTTTLTTVTVNKK